MNAHTLILTGLPLVLCAVLGHAFGIRVDDKDALATARGNAFTATADNPSALYYNPAGITQIDSPAYSGGGYALHYDVDYRNLNGQEFSNKSEYQVAPHAYFTLPVKTTPLTVGYTVHVPYGLENNWSENTSFSTIATKSSLRYMRHSPVVAWEVSPTWSIAAGLTINDADADLRRTHPHPAVDEIRLEGRDQALGYVVGWHWRPSEHHAFGATYRSHTRFDLTGTITVGPDESRAEADFPFPEVAVVGYSFRPTDAWNVELNVDWTNWDRLNAVALTTGEGANTQESEMPFHWKSSFIYKAGATRFFENDYRVSAGYMFSENSVPDDHFSPSVPDADRHLLSAGVGHTRGALSWDLAYQFAFSPTRKVRGSESPPGSPETADGDYDSTVHAVSASVSYAF